MLHHASTSECKASLNNQRSPCPRFAGVCVGSTRSVVCNDKSPNNPWVDFSMHRGELPNPAKYSNVIQGVRTVATPMLTPEKVNERLRTSTSEEAKQSFGAFYSSVLGGVITHPAYAVVKMNESMIQFGHGVHESMRLVEGFIFELDIHLERLVRSAAAANINHPNLDINKIKRIVLDTAAAAKKMNGTLKVVMTSGQASFTLPTSADSEAEPGLYVLVTTQQQSIVREEGWHAATSPIPNTAAPLAAVPAVSGLARMMARSNALAQGMDVGLLVTADGHVVEGDEFNIAAVTADDVLVVPPEDGTHVRSRTMQRVLDLIPKELSSGNRCQLTVVRVEERHLTVSDLQAAKEVICVNQGIGVSGIGSINGVDIGDGTPDVVALTLHVMHTNDLHRREDYLNDDRYTSIPFGYMTGMRSQLK